jgi:hypothetical protein
MVSQPLASRRELQVKEERERRDTRGSASFGGSNRQVMRIAPAGGRWVATFSVLLRRRIFSRYVEMR